MSLQAVTEADFPSLLSSEQPVVVDFWASWCAPCKALEPVLAQLSGEYPAVKFVKVDVMANQQLASQYQVQSVPTLLFIKEGRVFQQLVGAPSKAKLKDALDAL